MEKNEKVGKTGKVENVKTETISKIDELIMASAKGAKVTAEQFLVAIRTLAKLKNYFSDKERAYRLATNHKMALKSILEYVTTNKIASVEKMKDFIYCVRKESGKKSVDDETIQRCMTIKIEPRASQVKILKVIEF